MSKFAMSAGGPPSDLPIGENAILRIALQHKWIIVATTLIGICLAYLDYSRTSPVYQSTAQLLITEKQKKLPTDSLERTYQTAMKADEHALAIRSPAVIARAVEKDGLKKLPSLTEATETALAIREGFTAQPFQSSFLNLRYESANPEDSQTVLDALIAAYEKFLNTNEQNDEKELADQIRKAEAKLKIERRQIDQAIAEWTLKNANRVMSRDGVPINPHEQRCLALEASRQAQIDIIRDSKAMIETLELAIANGATARTVLSALSKDDPSRNGQMKVTQNAEPGRTQQLLEDYRQISSELRQARAREIQVSVEFGAEHPRRMELERRIRELDEERVSTKLEMQELYGPIGEGEATPDELDKALLHQELTALKLQLARHEKNLAGLNADFREEEKKSQEINILLLEYDALNRQSTMTQSLFDQTVQAVKEINLREETATRYLIKTMEAPDEGKKIRPVLTSSLARGVMLGMMVGMGIGYLLDLSDRTFRSPEEVGRLLEAPVWGHIPDMKGVKPSEGSPLVPALVTAHEPKSVSAETFRSVRTSLFFKLGTDQVIQITSPTPGDGKSTISANLAISIAQSGKKVVLLDADFRRPTQHKLFGLSNETGMANVMLGKDEFEDALQDTAIPNLHLLPCGPRPENPSELLTTPSFAALLDKAKLKFDYVLVDTPPLLAVSDPSIVASYVDLIVVSLRIRKNGRPAAEEAVRILQELKVAPAGIVINMIQDAAGGRYGGFGYGSRNYRYSGYRYGTYRNGKYQYGGGRYGRYGAGYGGEHVYGSEPADDAADENGNAIYDDHGSVVGNGSANGNGHSHGASNRYTS